LYKWILGIGALILTRKIGLAILGFAIGSLIDQYQQGAKGAQSSQQGYAQDPFEFYRRQSSKYDLPTMLMALSAAVMKADGKVLRIELDYVKSFFSAQFGRQFNATHLQTLKQFLDSPSIPLQDICHDIRNRMTPEAVSYTHLRAHETN
jgi:DnaJ like chaperone protein